MPPRARRSGPRGPCVINRSTIWSCEESWRGRRDWISGGGGGDPPSHPLSDSLRELGFARGRFKTGPPPRLKRDSLDLDRMERQEGDVPPRPLSYATHGRDV